MTPNEIAKQIAIHASRVRDSGFILGVIRPNAPRPGVMAVSVKRWNPDFQGKIKARFAELMQDVPFLEKCVSLMQANFRGIHTPKAYFVWAATRAGERAIAEAGGWAVKPVAAKQKMSAPKEDTTKE